MADEEMMRRVMEALPTMPIRAVVEPTQKKPQREWQGLTEYEVGFLTVFDGLHDVEVPLLANFIRHIEAKLKEKNT
jgi:hypothetical protein